jgi:hypothetical protein
MKHIRAAEYTIFIGLLIVLLNIPFTESYSDNGWEDLFNGTDLDGWIQINGFADYIVENGTIVGTTAEGSPNSFLCTVNHYCDFILEFEVNVDTSLNSGVQFRSNSFPEYREGRVHGYQVEISTDGNAGRIYDEARRSTWQSPDLRNNPEALNAFQDGEWNLYRVECSGTSIKTWINGIPIADIEDDMTDCGFIGLQVHSYQGDQPAQVRWRNIRLQELTQTDVHSLYWKILK